MPLARPNSTSSVAGVAAGFRPSTGSEQRASISAAPSSSDSTSIPHIAAENRPTGESTLNRPPTPSGTGSVAKPSCSQIRRMVPLAGSVTATMLAA